MNLNKRGFLLGEETLKIIIAIIAISFLVYLLFSLYSANKTSKDLELAESSLNYLIREINSLKEEEIRDIEIYNPNKWYLMSWPYDISVGGFFGIGSRIEEETPNSCSNLGWENCVCICKKDNPDSCDKKGICLESDFIIGEGNIKIEKPPLILTIDYENKIIQRKIQ